MFSIFVVIWIFQLTCNTSQAQRNSSLTSTRNRFYGPSYQPLGRQPEDVMRLRSDAFGYECSTNNPPMWPETFPGCGGSNQSPINIQTKELQKRKTRNPLQWFNYNRRPQSMILENSGHSIHANGRWTNTEDIPYITNGPLEKRYYFSQLHFHWGKTSATGSEHTVNGKRFPLEMHVVHDRRLEESTNLSEESESNGIVVVSFMFEIVQNDNPSLNNILEGAKEVRGYGESRTNIRPFPLDDLIDTISNDYVAYNGSLTTPPCTEGVIWIISSKPLGISERQLNVLRRSIMGRCVKIISNYRPVQDLNGRNVYYVYC